MALLFQLTQRLSGFAATWARWPRKEKKLDAEKAWNQKVKTPEIEDAIQESLDIWVPIFEARDHEFRPLLASWLRGERWNDQPPTPKSPTPNRATAITRSMTPEQITQLDAMNRVRALVETGMDREQAKQQVYREMGWVK